MPSFTSQKTAFYKPLNIKSLRHEAQSAAQRLPHPPRTTPITQGHNHTLKHDKTRKNIPPTIIILTKNMHT